MSPISSFALLSRDAIAFTPVPIPKLSPIGGGPLADQIQHLPPMPGGNLGDLIQHLPPMPGGSLADLLGGLLSGGGLHPSFPRGRQT